MRSFCPWIIFILAFSVLPVFPGPRGGLVLQFDDGWTQWRTLIAPELARVGGKATGFINNQYVQNGRITVEDLRALQDEFGWEIGTHTYHHFNAIRHVQQHGLNDWLEHQLLRSVRELNDAGLRVRNLVFPFNAFTPEIGQAARAHVDSFRRADAIALAPGRRPDGSIPGTSIDLTRHLPLPLLLQWVDLAQAQGQFLFLYGHRVLPDESFVTGRVVEVTADRLVAEAPIILPAEEDVVLVPDMARRAGADSLRGLSVEGNQLTVTEGSPDLRTLTAPGALFLIGPSYGTRLSDFRALLDHAAARMHFYTVAEAIRGDSPTRPEP